MTSGWQNRAHPSASAPLTGPFAQFCPCRSAHHGAALGCQWAIKVHENIHPPLALLGLALIGVPFVADWLVVLFHVISETLESTETF